MRVLYVNHTATVSGGERSLLDLLGALPEEVEATLAAPPGALTQMARARDVEVRGIRGTAGSLRLHPLHTPVALAEMALAGAAGAAGRDGLPRGGRARQLDPGRDRHRARETARGDESCTSVTACRRVP